jgi:nucleoside-triphosphatase THEP1
MVGADPLTPGWDFEPGVFAWASAVLSRATPCDLLVIDEIGPLELLGGRGWVTALHVLRSRAHGSALVVCRPGLLEELRMELVTVPTTLVEVTPQARDYLPAVLLTELRAAIAPSG